MCSQKRCLIEISCQLGKSTIAGFCFFRSPPWNNSVRLTYCIRPRLVPASFRAKTENWIRKTTPAERRRTSGGIYHTICPIPAKTLTFCRAHVKTPPLSRETSALTEKSHCTSPSPASLRPGCNTCSTTALRATVTQTYAVHCRLASDTRTWPRCGKQFGPFADISRFLVRIRLPAQTGERRQTLQAELRLHHPSFICADATAADIVDKLPFSGIFFEFFRFWGVAGTNSPKPCRSSDPRKPSTPPPIRENNLEQFMHSIAFNLLLTKCMLHVNKKCWSFWGF
jgi:hypothetical protein